MTAQIAIMNKEAIALASDSAVTMIGEDGEKIFTSANKLFSLLKYHPVGMMIFGSAVFMGVPWETIVKSYRKNLGKQKFATVKEYGTNFIEFLEGNKLLFPMSIQEEHLRSTFYAYFNYIKTTVEERIHSIIDERGQISHDEALKVVSKIIDEQYKIWEKSSNIPSIPDNFNKKLLEKYGKVINKAIRDTFEKIPLNSSQLNKLRTIASSLFSKFPEDVENESMSGIIIAGFGEEEFFPAITGFQIEGITESKLKYLEREIPPISFERSAAIIPFAQSEMVATFMEGIDPDYKMVEESYLSEVFGEYIKICVDKLSKYPEKEKKQLRKELVKFAKEILKEHNTRLSKFRREKYIDPVIRVVSILPRDELAAMAESLVNLTSFKRKVSMERETVGGPIDVAVISKGDGFIWIKRKHYFKAELNPQFFANYYREEQK